MMGMGGYKLRACTVRVLKVALVAFVALLAGWHPSTSTAARLTVYLEQPKSADSSTKLHKKLLEQFLIISLKQKSTLDIFLNPTDAAASPQGEWSLFELIDDRKRNWMEQKSDTRYFLLGRYVKDGDALMLSWQVIDVGSDRSDRANWEVRPPDVFVFEKDWGPKSLMAIADTIAKRVIEQEREVKKKPVVHVLCFYAEGIGNGTLNEPERAELARLIANLSVALLTKVHVEVRKKGGPRFDVRSTQVTKVHVVCNEDKPSGIDDAYAVSDHVIHGRLRVLAPGKILLVAMLWSSAEHAPRELDRWESDVSDELGLSSFFAEKIAEKLIPHLAGYQ